MKLKNIIYTLSLGLVVTAGLSSCGTNWMDVEPSDGVDANGALNSVTALNSARIGLYAAFKGNHNLTDYYARQMFTYGDERGEDIQFNNVNGSARSEFYYYMTYSTADDFNRGDTPWQSPYIVIGRANRIINADNVTGEEADEYKAEAKVIRAYALFDLTRIYGVPYTKDNGASLGVPFSATALESSAKSARKTVAECYTQVLADLNEAISSNTLSTKATTGYVNVWTAKALLTRVYLTMGNWDKALSTAEDIIEHSPYKLWTAAQYATAWSEADANHGNEMIFEFVINNNNDWTDREGIAYLYRENGSSVSGYGDLIVTKKFVDMLASDPQDVRNNIIIAAESAKGKAGFGTNKVFLNKFQPLNDDVRYDDVPMLRLSEVYLSAAEAAFNAGNKEKAAKYLNDIISNRTTDASKAVTAADVTLERIYVERRKELVGEGQRYFDVLRRGETVVRYTNEADKGWHDALNEEARTFNRDSKKALPLIPQNEIDANQEIVQNPLYTK
jgi:tetratricopeptide (TPR) repeat protein